MDLGCRRVLLGLGLCFPSKRAIDNALWRVNLEMETKGIGFFSCRDKTESLNLNLVMVIVKNPNLAGREGNGEGGNSVSF